MRLSLRRRHNPAETQVKAPHQVPPTTLRLYAPNRKHNALRLEQRLKQGETLAPPRFQVLPQVTRRNTTVDYHPQYVGNKPAHLS